MHQRLGSVLLRPSPCSVTVSCTVSMARRKVSVQVSCCLRLAYPATMMIPIFYVLMLDGSSFSGAPMRSTISHLSEIAPALTFCAVVSGPGPLAYLLQLMNMEERVASFTTRWLWLSFSHGGLYSQNPCFDVLGDQSRTSTSFHLGSSSSSTISRFVFVLVRC